MIRFVEDKRPDLAFVARALEASGVAGQWSNFGPVSLLLEQRLHRDLLVPASHSLVASSSGTSALFALVGLHGFLAKRPLRWVVSALTFRCQRQGPLSEAFVVDCSESGMITPATLEALDPGSFDGVILTPLFGMPEGTAAVASWCRRMGKVLLLDAATGVDTTEDGQPLGLFGDGAAFSLHHTKPMGFGEGGFLLVRNEFEATARSVLNFGRYRGIDTGPWSFNGKLSDPAAAFLLDRWRHRDAVRDAHLRQFQRIERLADGVGCHPLIPLRVPGHFPSCVPLLLPRPHALDPTSAPVPWMRYYEPLASGMPTAAGIHARILCLPCHPGMDGVPDQAITQTLERALDS